MNLYSIPSSISMELFSVSFEQSERVAPPNVASIPAHTHTHTHTHTHKREKMQKINKTRKRISSASHSIRQHQKEFPKNPKPP